MLPKFAPKGAARKSGRGGGAGLVFMRRNGLGVGRLPNSLGML